MFERLTIRNWMAITVGVAVAFGAAFTRFDHVVEIPVQPNSVKPVLVIKPDWNVFQRVTTYSGQKSRLDLKRNVTSLKPVSTRLPVAKWELDVEHSSFTITYNVNFSQKLQLIAGVERRFFN